MEPLIHVYIEVPLLGFLSLPPKYGSLRDQTPLNDRLHPLIDDEPITFLLGQSRSVVSFVPESPNLCQVLGGVS